MYSGPIRIAPRSTRTAAGGLPVPFYVDLLIVSTVVLNLNLVHVVAGAGSIGFIYLNLDSQRHATPTRHAGRLHPARAIGIAAKQAAKDGGVPPAPQAFLRPQLPVDGSAHTTTQAGQAVPRRPPVLDPAADRAR